MLRLERCGLTAAGLLYQLHAPQPSASSLPSLQAGANGPPSPSPPTRADEGQLVHEGAQRDAHAPRQREALDGGLDDHDVADLAVGVGRCILRQAHAGGWVSCGCTTAHHVH